MKVTVDGMTGCPYFEDAKKRWQAVAKTHTDVELDVHDRGPKDSFKAWVQDASKELGKEWKTSPLVKVDGELVGGRDESVKYISERFPEPR